MGPPNCPSQARAPPSSCSPRDSPANQNLLFLPMSSAAILGLTQSEEGRASPLASLVHGDVIFFSSFQSSLNRGFYTPFLPPRSAPAQARMERALHLQSAASLLPPAVGFSLAGSLESVSC